MTAPRLSLRGGLSHRSPRHFPFGFTCLDCRKLGSSLNGSGTSRIADSTSGLPPALLEPRLTGRAKDKVADRGLFLDVLNSTASKREAKSYLSRFERSKRSSVPLEVKPQVGRKESFFHKPQVNLGGLFVRTRAADDAPSFNHQPSTSAPLYESTDEPIHVILVQIKAPHEIADELLNGIGHTLAQLSRLGIIPIVVVDGNDENVPEGQAKNQHRRRNYATQQADRVVQAIESSGDQRARHLQSILDVSGIMDQSAISVRRRQQAVLTKPHLLVSPLRRGVIPVISPSGYNIDDYTLTDLTCREVILSLTREFAGLNLVSRAANAAESETIESKCFQKQISLDRLIILDSKGGIPASDKFGGSHVFINLEQEYQAIGEDLRDRSPPREANSHQDFEGDTRSHITNLRLARDTLALLPSTSSALITTPFLASNALNTSASSTLGVGTRPHPSPLIHNILTDKPTYSSSLPLTRLSPYTHPSTFLKKGMPLTILPDPRATPWQPPTSQGDNQPPILNLSDPRIDLPRLVHLIEDSFSRKLDVQHYLSRLQNSLAGLIVAGSYEGCALLTWEVPPSLAHLPRYEIPADRFVPYLDKFAVLKKSQGTGGVADIVFSAMVGQCFPKGVVWRSRRENVVNKWYFERAKGTWKIPVKETEGKKNKAEETAWTMFWTTESVNARQFADYEGVCRGVVPSWGDGKDAE